MTSRLMVYKYVFEVSVFLCSFIVLLLGLLVLKRIMSGISIEKCVMLLSENSPENSDSDELINEKTLLSSSSDTSTECKPRRKLHRVQNYMKTIEEYDDQEFKEHFRLQHETCNFVIELITNANVLPRQTYGRKKVSPKKAVYITLWYLANTETFRQVADRFNVTKSTVYRIVVKITDFLVKTSPTHISWPNAVEMRRVRNGFREFQGIDNVIGAIDGTHIKIKKPVTRYAEMYYNRKGDYSILLQAVCDHRKKFTDVFCGEAGSMHDARLLKKSSLYEKGLLGYFGNDFILGDSAYPCLDWLITPYKNNGNLTRNQKIFNYRHSSSRVVIENAFGLLKSRFRRLKTFENDNIIFIVKCVIAATVLHNICCDFNDEIECDSEECNDEEDEEQYVQAVSGITPRISKRDEIFNKMFNN